jgi:hypothetical protein
MCASTCYLIGAIAFLAKIVIDTETRYRLLETIREYGEERLDEAGQTDRWQARHADYYVDVLKQIRHHDRRAEVFWAVRLSAKQDNLLAAWSWAIDTRNIDTAKWKRPATPARPTRRPQISNDQDQLQENGSREGLRRSHDDDDGNRDGDWNTLARTLGIPNSA